MLKLRLILLFGVLAAGSSAFAYCLECSIDSYGCRICATTEYNGFGACQLINNGSQCEMWVFCEGPMGERCAPPAWNGCVEQRAEASAPVTRPRREWQLVSVTIGRSRRTPRS